MKKNIILLGSLILSSVAYSQVGIDTKEPKATLDVVVKSDKLNKPFGIIAPRVTGIELRNAGGQFNADQDGAIVYATSSAETTTGRAKNVTQRGYYYFDATLDNGSSLGLWVALKNAPAEYVEPWNQAGTSTPADANNQAIYQTGAVSIWRNKVFESTASGSAKVDLHVNGATRIGATDPNVSKKVGASSFAGGNAAVASGDNSMAYGTSVEASGDSSSAFGNATGAIGSNSIAMGNQSTAVGENSAAFGFKTTSSAINSLSIGASTSAMGAQSFAGGINSTASGEHSLAMGNNTKATAFASASFGELSEANSTYSLSAGYYNQTQNPGEAAFGVYNMTTSGALFTVGDGSGNGASNVTRRNIISAQKANGGSFVAVGSGTAVPSKVQDETLRVYGGALANKAYVTGINSEAGAATDKLVVADPTTGQLKTITSSSIAPTITADNGLNKTGNNVQLGGNLVKATSIGTNGTVTLALTGLENTGTTSDKIIVSSTHGVLKTIDASSLPNATYQEPWNQAGTSTPADANNQAIYQSGAVSIWRNKVFESTASGSAKVDLHVNGATRVGGQDPNVAKSVGGNSFAGGNAPVASGNNSMAYGTSVEASGTNSAAFGNNSKAVGTESIAMGNNTTATGDQSFAGGGNGSTATGQYAFAFGNNAQAKANHAVAMGVGTVAPARSSATFGRYNVNTFTSPNIALNSPGDPIFQVGSGPDDARRYNIITTFLGTNGSTGVGGGWMAIGGDLNTMPVKVQDETLRVYGGTLANKAYVTDINSEAGAATDKLVVADGTTGQLKTITASSLPNATYQEPWNQAGTTIPATANGQAIYQKGAVSIWRDKVFESTASGSAKVDLHVNGATRIGATDPNVSKKVGESSFAGGNAAVASGNNSISYGNSSEASGSSSVALGDTNVSSGSSSFTAGSSNKVRGVSSVALGSSNEIDSDANFSIVGGLNNLIKNKSLSAVALGSLNSLGINSTVNNAIAFGYRNKIDQSDNAMAAGIGNTIGLKARADASIAQGSGNSIDSDFSAAIGLENEIGQYSNTSFALGQKARIAGTGTGAEQNAYNSYALGYKATVGYDSVDGTTVTGANSAYAIGSEALANGKYSYAIGYRAKAKAYGAIAIGTESNINVPTVASTVASGRNSIAIGSGINVSSQNNTAIGSYNIAGLDASFAVGIGNDINSRKNGLMVFNNGKAAIGSYSSAPSFNMGETLQVYGKITTTSATYPDYVFEDYYTGNSTINANYKFSSLYDTEKFIKENRHLPGVTSLTELQKNDKGYSFNITDLSTQTLEKVEELYLHTIEQQKQIDELKDIVKQQQKQIDQLLKK